MAGGSLSVTRGSLGPKNEGLDWTRRKGVPTSVSGRTDLPERMTRPRCRGEVVRAPAPYSRLTRRSNPPLQNSVAEPVDANEKYGFELQPFDVLDVKDSHFLVVARDASFLAPDNGNVTRLEQRSRRIDKRIDQVVAIHEDRDGWQPADAPFNFVNPVGQPLGKPIPRKAFA